MGEPYQPTDREREERIALAKAFIDAVRADEESPLDLLLQQAPNDARTFRGLEFSYEIVLMLFCLAQEVEMLNDELRDARMQLRALQAALS